MDTQKHNELQRQGYQTYMQDTHFMNGMPPPLLEEKNQQDIEVGQQDDARPNLESLIQTDAYVTSYVCLLVPRFEEHLLTGDLTDQLYIWMKDICISFGWQLKFIDINPKYIHWIMTVSLATYPTQFMKTVRKESSNRIFQEFPKFSHKNMSNDFWAPWYFVGVGDVPYSKNSIQSFLRQIRMEQGLY